MCESDLKKILENHLHWLREDCEGWENMRADLSGADLSGAINLFVPLACPDTGSFIAYKKAGNSLIVKLEIPEDAHRSSATGRKCRCDKARVLEIQNLDGSKSGVTCVQSKFDPRFVYKVGCVVEEPDFCEGLVKCSRIALEYSRQKDFDIQMKTFCWDRYTNCEIYRVLIEKEEYCE